MLSPASPAVPKTLPNRITTHDILKCAAVLIMIVDHIGAYFFPDDMWWRAVGRIGFPVWFFLMGYARSRTIDRTLLIGAVLLIIGDLLTGRSPIPTNALVTMILLRLGTQPVMAWVNHSIDRLFVVTVLCGALYMISIYVCEYGTLAFIFSICGYMARNGFGPHKRIPEIYGVICLFVFTAIMGLQSFPLFTPTMNLFDFIGSGIVMAALFRYLPRTDPGFTLEQPLLKKTVMFMGRRTLEIYVVHLLLFKAIWYFGVAEGLIKHG